MSEIRFVPLSRGQHAIIDADDFERISRVKWSAVKKGDNFYAARSQPTVYMHRLIVGAMNPQVVDHVNGDTLDNRKSNLRLCLHAQNMCNAKLRASNSSGFIGVCWKKTHKKWHAYIYSERRKHHVGYFANIAEAAKARDLAAIKFHGEFARLNFPTGDSCEK